MVSIDGFWDMLERFVEEHEQMQEKHIKKFIKEFLDDPEIKAVLISEFEDVFDACLEQATQLNTSITLRELFECVVRKLLLRTMDKQFE